MSEHASPPDGQSAASEATALSAIVKQVVVARRAIAQAQAAEARALAEAGELAMAQMARIDSPLSRDREMPLRSIAAELATATRQSERTVKGHIDDATTLAEHYSATFAAWTEGRISRSHVTAVLDAGSGLAGTDARARFDEVIAARAESETPAQLRATARMTAERMHPRSLTERHVDARARRAVRLFDLPDGMSELITVQPTVLAHGIHDRLTQQAKAITAAARAAADDDGDEAARDDRTTDQIRADLLADMLLTAAPGADPTSPQDAPGGLRAIRAIVQVTVPVTTLSGASETAGTLNGHRPVDPESARRLAGNAPGWDRVLTHPISGAVLTVDRYRPGEDLKRLLRARDQHCRFPGCRMPAHRCDLDHTIDAAHGGPTCDRNLGHLCRGHHSLKHASQWRVRQLAGGTFEWTSPTGRVHTDHPPAVAFVPDDHPPPW